MIVRLHTPVPGYAPNGYVAAIIRVWDSVSWRNYVQGGIPREGESESEFKLRLVTELMDYVTQQALVELGLSNPEPTGIESPAWPVK